MQRAGGRFGSTWMFDGGLRRVSVVTPHLEIARDNDMSKNLEPNQREALIA